MRDQLLGIDWGTTNRRAYLVDAQGRCRRSHSDEHGMLAEHGRFGASLDALLATMQLSGDIPVLMSGMIGSAQGWQEAPYLGCEVALAELPRHLVAVRAAQRAGPTWIVPGYCYRNNSGSDDVMRGEETQLLGAQALGQGDGWVVLPGTHSKWVLLEGGRIARWTTYITGELFAALAQGGTLAPLMNAAGTVDDAGAFAAGLELARQRDPLTHSLFTIRARVVSGALEPARTRSFVSGLLIGTEFAAMAAAIVAQKPGSEHGFRTTIAKKPGALTLVGSAALAGHYRSAAHYFGLGVSALDPDAVYCAALAHFLCEVP